ncbi:MAG: CsoS2 family carboxysome shell protein [Burkholderiales bacterium]|nr:CsoS2 family carboxysome shell protein [Burkholderiales bacterium]
MSQATATPPGEALSGREAALARRRALSLKGKGATPGPITSGPASATAVRLAARNSAAAPVAANPAAPTAGENADAASCGCQHGEPLSARVEEARPAANLTPLPLSPARQRRMEQSLRGRGDAPPSRPCGRVRPQPTKVEIGTTLAGTPVTGSQVERTSRVTGNEAGTCRTITGTEYVGAEQFRDFCGTLPEPSPAKVGVTSTSRGHRVTGTQVGRSSKVTGDEYGTCKRVTGTEYLAAEQVRDFCGTAPEPGAQPAISGQNEEGNAPKKVEVSHTSAGARVTGTLLGRSPSLTGVEQGSCKRVTGTDYIPSEEFVSFCREQPYQPPAKVGVSRTIKGQVVTGAQVGRSVRVTGDEYGACKPVTGSAYIGAEQYAEFCAARAAAEAINRARLGRSPAVTGIQPGPDSKLTGNARGACQPVSGTPYVGEDQSAEACGTPPAPRVSSGFSITTPARMARNSEVRRITGSAYGDNGRITGPMARAVGLVSGTPEFRYRDETASAAPSRRPDGQVDRITGEGRARQITGDAWDRNDRVTGTEGRSAQSRNPTLRGAWRGGGLSARDHREAERPTPAPSRITGSSGNTEAGALVTLSGGARG